MDSENDVADFLAAWAEIATQSRDADTARKVRTDDDTVVTQFNLAGDITARHLNVNARRTYEIKTADLTAIAVIPPGRVLPQSVEFRFGDRQALAALRAKLDPR